MPYEGLEDENEERILPPPHLKRDESNPNLYYKLCSIAFKGLIHVNLPHFRMLKLKNKDEVCLLKTKQLHLDCLLFSVIANGKDGDGLHFEKFSLNFSKFSYSSSMQNQKCTRDYSSWKKND